MNKIVKAAALATLMFAATVARADGLASADKTFLDKASNAGHTEIEASKLVVQKSTSAEVKTFADEMMKDHMAVGLELTTLASSKGVTVPDMPSLTQQGKLKLLGTKKAGDFDRAYVKDIGVQAHKDTVALFKKASTDAKDPDIKAWAAKTLPSLEHHLMEAQALEKGLPKKGSTKAKAT
ncbi:hypothetical protein BH09PSE6_BH09PSE6_00920 [soil metagenome]